MPCLYLLESKDEKVGVLCSDDKKDNFSIGKETKFLQNRSRISGKIKIFIDTKLYLDIIRVIRDTSLISSHFKRGSYFFTVDNNIWILKTLDIVNDYLVEYKKIYFL